MKAVLYSINRPHTDNIKSGLKLWEIRKSKPNIPVPFTAFTYETKKKGGCGKVIGEFICDRIEMVNAQCSDYGIDLFYHDCATEGCLIENEVNRYFNIPEDKDLRVMKGNGYALHISNLKIYDKPKELIEFFKPCPNSNEDYRCLSCDCLADSDYGGYCTNYLTRPPQSWCYVEI